MIIGLHHAQITIPQGKEEEGRRFYCQTLGITEADKPDELAGRGGFWLQVGSRQVHIGTESGVERELTKAHIAYEVDNLHEMKQILQHHQIKLIDSVAIPGYDRVEIRDPFGNRVEFIQKRSSLSGE
jgi:catechol 2,3-dioxygenase-like lactoylglutathione lyase family enzyme